MSRLTTPAVPLRPSHASPVVAVLDSGLDAFAPLAAGTRVVAARSFVGGHPFVDGVGTGTECATVLARSLAGRWSPNGASEVRLVVAQVVDRDGVQRVDAIRDALAWLRGLDIGVDAVAVAWGAGDPDALRGAARPLARAGFGLYRLDRALPLVLEGAA